MKNLQEKTLQQPKASTLTQSIAKVFLGITIALPLVFVPSTHAELTISEGDISSKQNPLLITDEVNNFRQQALVKIAKNNKAIELKNANIITKVSGQQLQSTITLTLHNPNDRILEGELILPLADGQRITGFALDINGEMREAVPVEKQKGRQAFEDTIRQKVDPALLEKTVGNEYRLRIYPLPKKGQRTVQLTIEQTLQKTNSKLQTDIPFHWLADSHNTKHKLMVNGWQQGNVRVISDGQKVKAKGASTLIYDLDTVALNKKLSLILTPDKSMTDGVTLTTQTDQDEMYIYGEIPTALITKQLGKKNLSSTPKVNNVAVIWDASLSRNQADTKSEITTLITYLKQLGDVTVTLQLVRNSLSKAVTFTIKNGDTTAIEKALTSIDYDGASRLSGWQLPSKLSQFDSILVFTDGQETFNAKSDKTDKIDKTNSQADSPFANISYNNRPQILKYISSNATANITLLNHWAKQTQGNVVNVNKIDKTQAVQAIATFNPTVRIESNELTDINLNNADLKQGDVLTVTAKVKEEFANGTADFSKGITFDINSQSALGRSLNTSITVALKKIRQDDLASKIWADMQIDTLSGNAKVNKKQILQLGKDYGRVTDFTSLIVLDTVEDYARHHIIPPASLREQYDKIIAQEEKAESDSQKKQLENVYTRQKELIDWWKKDYPKDKPKNKKKRLEKSGLAAESISGAMAMADRSANGFDAEPSVMDKMEEEKASGNSALPTPTSANIKIKAWSSDKPYVKAVENAIEKGADVAYQEYLTQRKVNQASPSFYLDMAEVFFKHKKTDLAMRILSNLAEISNDDRQLLRVLAYRLNQAKHYDEAILVLEKVKQLAPGEPQSWRDLGLAYADNASTNSKVTNNSQWQQATDNLWHVIAKNWQGRFSDIDMIALNEFNDIVANHKVDTSNYDKRLLTNLPVGMRVVLSWDTDNSDMDLWVTDPNGEKVFYRHKNSYQGGRISNDFTGGYGPEEFMLKEPKKGTYKVEAHFYGTGSQKVSTQTTLQLRFYNNFGMPSVTEERVMLSLKPNDKEVLVGEFEVD